MSLAQFFTSLILRTAVSLTKILLTAIYLMGSPMCSLMMMHSQTLNRKQESSKAGCLGPCLQQLLMARCK